MKIVLASLFVEIIFLNYVSCYENSDKLARSGHTEGDMILPRRNRNGLVDPAYRWPNKTVCYHFFGNFSQEEINTIYLTLNTGFAGTCIKFVHCACNGKYINITNDEDGCFSEVGFLNEPQQINFGQDCIERHIIIHEFMHALGFFHEQSRADRDTYVEILFENIDPEIVDNFDIPPEPTTAFGQPYDYCSLMHYGRYAGSKNGRETIRPRCASQCEIGVVTELSQVDKNKINLMYNCTDEYPVVPVQAPCT